MELLALPSRLIPSNHIRLGQVPDSLMVRWYERGRESREFHPRLGNFFLWAWKKKWRLPTLDLLSFNLFAIGWQLFGRLWLKTRTRPDHMDHVEAIHFTDHGSCFSKNFPFHGLGIKWSGSKRTWCERSRSETWHLHMGHDGSKSFCPPREGTCFGGGITNALEEVLPIMRHAESDSSLVSLAPPAKPKAGDVFVYLHVDSLTEKVWWIALHIK